MSGVAFKMSPQASGNSESSKLVFTAFSQKCHITTRTEELLKIGPPSPSTSCFYSARPSPTSFSVGSSCGFYQGTPPHTHTHNEGSWTVPLPSVCPLPMHGCPCTDKPVGVITRLWRSVNEQCAGRVCRNLRLLPVCPYERGKLHTPFACLDP